MSFLEEVFDKKKEIISYEEDGLLKWPEPYEDDYHSAPEYVSNSLLYHWDDNEYLFWKLFYKVEGYEQKESKAMVLGQMIHSFLLEPDGFYNIYYQALGNGGSNQFKAVAQELASLGKSVDELSTAEITEAFGHHYSSKNKAMEYWSEKGLKDTVANLIKSSGRTPISPYEEDMLNEIKSRVQENNICRYLLSGPETYTERELYWHTVANPKAGLTEGGAIRCKCKIDRIKIDRNNLYLIDLKTTSIELREWSDLCRRRGYIRQLAFYRKALLENFPEQLKGMNIHPYILLVHLPSKSVFSYYVSKSDIERATYWIEDALSEIYDSFERGCTNHTRRYYLSSTGDDRLLTGAADFYIGFDDPFDTSKTLHKEDVYS